MRSFTHGDRIKVYEDPITETRLEGEAMVLARLSTDAIDKLVRLRVRFYDGGETVERWVSLVSPAERERSTAP